MRVLLMFFVSLILASNACAQHPFWLDEAIRVDDPDEFAYWTSIQRACPLTEAEVVYLIEETLVENELRPVRDKIFEDGRIYLNVDLRCIKLASDDQHAFTLNIHYGRYKPWPAILFDAPYSEVGIGGKATISRKFRQRMKEAVAAFKKANTLTVGQHRPLGDDSGATEFPATGSMRPAPAVPGET